MDIPTDVLMCRLCGIKLTEEDSKYIFDKTTNLAQKIIDTLPISVSQDDGHSKHICSYCHKRITRHYEFIQNVLEYSKKKSASATKTSSLLEASRSEKMETISKSLYSDMICLCPNCNVDLMILIRNNPEDYAFQISLAVVDQTGRSVTERNIQSSEDTVESNNVCAKKSRTNDELHGSSREFVNNNERSISETCGSSPQSREDINYTVVAPRRKNPSHLASNSQKRKFQENVAHEAAAKSIKLPKLETKLGPMERDDVSNNDCRCTDGSIRFKSGNEDVEWLNDEMDSKGENSTVYTTETERDRIDEDCTRYEDMDIKNCLKIVCDLCGARYLSQLKYEFHMERHKLNKMDKYVCTICDKEASSENLLWDHYFHMHKSSVRYACLQCGKLFAKKPRLNGHQKRHKHSGIKEIHFETGTDDPNISQARQTIAIEMQERVTVNCSLCGKLITDLDPGAINDLATCAACEDSTLSLMVDGNETKVISPRQYTLILPVVGESFVEMAREKRSQDQDEVLHARTVLVDIEGTTTSISFVKETLFPYVRQHLKNYIETKWEDEEFKQDYEMLKEQAKKDEEEKLDGFVAIAGDKPEEEKDSLLKNVFWQMDNDRKTGALKQLQGHMWREAYKTGAVKAHVYEDVPKALESWTNDGKKIYVYSSGSVEAQELLFEHSVHGNLLKYFSGFFDTKVGAKQESDSYKNILSNIGEKPSNVVFLTDIVREAAAAKEAGLSTVIVVRDGNAALTDKEKITYTTIKSFLDLTFQTTAKRQKVETDEKSDECTTNVCEPMDTSEDVDMPDRDIVDQSNQRVEKNEAKETAAESSERKECADGQPSKDGASCSLAQAEEPMTVEKDSSKVEQETSASEATEPKAKETSENPNASESEEQTAKNDNATKDSTKIAVSEKTEENSDAIAPTADDSINMSVPESASASENAATSSEKETEGSTDLVKDTQSDKVADTVETTATDKKANDHGSEACEKSKVDKTEESLKMEKDEAKEESKAESENVSAKSEPEEAAAKPQTSAAENLTENGETVETAGGEKSPAKPTVAEVEAAANTTVNVKEDATPPSKVSTEKSLDVNEQAEKTDEKTAEETKAGETNKPADVEERDNEAAQQETAKEKATVKEGTVVDTKDKNAVDSEKQKLNGTTQNGDADVPVLDDKLHSNGLNEGSSKETTGEDETAAQNGEPESSSESSAESIKVKKVVDSTVADGAGEPDVVPPVVVAATS
ncbi:enolase-phosphatase E1 [Ooceraea biroi]|uniref:enolase-phosphatase E1 n=1 Tax=Ooceraea biroi TaxID=2015173 RepID=UPI000F093DB3|nr:enolase-phosphatase E1 [Ooceraea biroi]